MLNLQRHLLKHAGGDRVMAQVLSAIPIHGLEEVLVAVELALESWRFKDSESSRKGTTRKSTRKGATTAKPEDLSTETV